MSILRGSRRSLVLSPDSAPHWAREHPLGNIRSARQIRQCHENERPSQFMTYIKSEEYIAFYDTCQAKNF